MLVLLQEAVDIVKSELHNGANAACQELIEVAKLRWQEEEGDYRDDVSALSFPLQFSIESDVQITAIVVCLPLPFQTASMKKRAT